MGAGGWWRSTLIEVGGRGDGIGAYHGLKLKIKKEERMLQIGSFLYLVLGCVNAIY